MNWQERAEKAEESLRSLASYVGAGGHNAMHYFEYAIIAWGVIALDTLLDCIEDFYG